jgi:UDP-N-acetylmuramoyl-L-alanyl-D-glutamate--2,6-diaminopimelate ligase
MKRVEEILTMPGILQTTGSLKTGVLSLHMNSAEVKPGGLFFAIKGTNADGHTYIPNAIGAGAKVVVCEVLPTSLAEGVTYIRVENTAVAAGFMSSLFYDNPSGELALTGVTGTNGKTTTVTLLHELFRKLGYKTGLLSTIVNKIDDREVPATHTTADPVQLNRMLRDMADAGCTHCFMEVSSHAADQHRIAGLTFRGGIFTNITHDHLDYHKTFDAYLAAKKSFFDGLPKGAFALVNKDDRNGMVMLQNCAASKYTYSLRAMADFRCRIVENRFQGLQLDIDGYDAWFRLIGRFNAYNLLVAYATAVLLGQEKLQVLTVLSTLDPVEGRFNYVNSPNGVTAIVDYAHTPDALRNVLETINDIRDHNEQLITVAGAGGNRDAAKRPVMARIACEMSDRVILTSDNPRFEEPEAILDDMKKGVDPSVERKVLVIVNRHEAIRTACALAQPGDIILVAGKGHETYQEVKGVKHHFDDKEELNSAFAMINPGNSKKS